MFFRPNIFTYFFGQIFFKILYITYDFLKSFFAANKVKIFGQKKNEIKTYKKCLLKIIRKNLYIIDINGYNRYYK